MTATDDRAWAFQVLTDAGADGLTDEEIAGRCSLTHKAAQARRTELVRAGVVTLHPDKRAAASGWAAKVWHVVHLRDADGMQGCPCACGHITPVANWDWGAIMCPGCGDEVPSPLAPGRRGRLARAVDPSTVELRMYVTPGEAEDIKARAADRGQSISAFLRIAALG